MKSVSDIIDALGGSSAVAGALKLPATTTASWKSRNSIPVEHWPKLTAAALERGVEDLTYETLVSAHTDRVVS